MKKNSFKFVSDGGTRVLTILNDGKIGIGTSSPGAKLEVDSDSNIATIINSTSTFTFIDIE